ncbi:hypothetical protein H6A68_00560 [Bifidobacterium pullorum subsp. saeculare]|nr:hypothetical protein [Bifidobacterium pullorum subsp. saeculare]
MSSVGPAEAFTSREQAYLSSLPAVEHVTSGRIYYTEAFKKECIRRIEQRLACIESRLGMQAGECSENEDTPIEGDDPGARLAPVDR